MSSIIYVRYIVRRSSTNTHTHTYTQAHTQTHAQAASTRPRIVFAAQIFSCFICILHWMCVLRPQHAGAFVCVHVHLLYKVCTHVITHNGAQKSVFTILRPSERRIGTSNSSMRFESCWMCRLFLHAARSAYMLHVIRDHVCSKFHQCKNTHTHMHVTYYMWKECAHRHTEGDGKKKLGRTDWPDQMKVARCWQTTNREEKRSYFCSRVVSVAVCSVLQRLERVC